MALYLASFWASVAAAVLGGLAGVWVLTGVMAGVAVLALAGMVLVLRGR